MSHEIVGSLQSQGTRLTGVGPYRQEPHPETEGVEPTGVQTGRDLERAPFQCLILFSVFKFSDMGSFQIWAQTEVCCTQAVAFCKCIHLSVQVPVTLTGETEEKILFQSVDAK